MKDTGVLLVAYGAPRSLEDVAAFLAEEWFPEAVPEDVLTAERRKLLTVGGHAPLHAACSAIAMQLERRLSGLPATDPSGEDSVISLGFGAEVTSAQSDRVRAESGVPVEVGMLHGSPGVSDALMALRARGAVRVVQVSLSPFESVGASEARRAAASAATEAAGLEGVEALDYGGTEGFTAVVGDACIVAREEIPLDMRTIVVFAAPGTGSRGTGGGSDAVAVDEAAARVADMCGLGPATVGGARLPGIDASGGTGASTAWVVASAVDDAGGTRPGLRAVIDAAAEAAYRAVEICPIGFVVEQMLTVHEMDVLGAERVYGHDMEFARARVPGAEPAMIDVLEEAVRAVL